MTMKLFMCVALLSFASKTLASCTFDVKKETFDLTPLVNTGGGSYNVKDTQSIGTNNVQHTYWFNFCNNIQPPNEACVHTQGTSNIGTKVAKTDCVALSKENNCDAPVFQTFQDSCHRLGKKFKQGEKPTASFYDPKNPARGVKILYEGGDQCGENEDKTPRYRKFLVNVICDPDDTGVNIPDDEPIFENPICEYRLTLMSIHGCPSSCGTVNGKICNGQGECGFDKDEGKSRCFCFDGFYGDQCLDTTVWNPANTTSIIVMGVMAVVLLAALITFTILVWRRVKSLRLDPEAYSSMGGEMALKTEEMETLQKDDFDDEDDV